MNSQPVAVTIYHNPGDAVAPHSHRDRMEHLSADRETVREVAQAAALTMGKFADWLCGTYFRRSHHGNAFSIRSKLPAAGAGR